LKRKHKLFSNKTIQLGFKGEKSMQNYIDRALESFQPVFSRTSTWLLFCAIVMGFMGAGEMIGVTSLCRFWLLDEDGYNVSTLKSMANTNATKMP
jgi:uncharacterized membrane protein